MNTLLIIMKALSDETRLKIMTLLLNHDFCVGALARQLKISEAAVSQHLQILRKAGLIKGEKRGYYTHYSVEREMLINTAKEMIELASQEPNKNINCHKNM